MVWLIIVIIVVGYFIVSAINRSTETKARVDLYNNLSDEEKVVYLEEQQKQAKNNARMQLNKKIYSLIANNAKSDTKIAQDKTIQNLGFTAGTPISGAEAIREIKRNGYFLMVNNLAPQYLDLIKQDLPNKKIAWELGKPGKLASGSLSWHTRCYREEDIEAMKEDFALHHALNDFLGISDPIPEFYESDN